MRKSVFRFSITSVMIGLCLLLAGCNSNPHDQTTPPDQTVSTSTKQVQVTKVDFGDRWPLTVDHAVIINDNDAIYLEIGGVKYAANGFARSLAAKNGTPDIEKSNYLNQDKTIYLFDIIKRGLALNTH